MSTLIENPAALQTNHLPDEFVDREDEQAALKTAFSDITETSSRNLHIHGPRGQGKTHITHRLLEELPDRVNTCYVACQQYDTQYKVLKQLYHSVSNEGINGGYHTSDLQREIEKRTGSIETVMVLDEVDFLFLNDGDSLLYYLSRFENSDNLSVITISANHQELPIEERTKSSLHPQRINLPTYTADKAYQILLERAKKALTHQSLQQEALTYIASTTSNLKTSLHWLRTAAKKTDNIITEQVVKETQETSYQKYVDQLLTPFSDHHNLVYQAIDELTEEQEQSSIRSGSIYTRYQELCKAYSEKSLTERRISDFLKHLELLHLIQADYHYGGENGKTRDIRLNQRNIK